MIKAILACDATGGIAANGVMPWSKNSQDLRYFKQLTQGHTVVMGRKTWEATDMPSPLPGRTNVVVTRDTGYTAPGATVVTQDIPEYLNKLATEDTVFLIGGASLFHELIEHINILHLTRISCNWGCDTFLDLDKVAENFTLVDSLKADSNTTFEVHFARRLHDLSLNTDF